LSASTCEKQARGRTGKSAKAQRLLHELQTLSQQQQLDPAQFLNVAYVGMDKRGIWLSWLQKVCRERTNIPAAFKVDPIYDPIRNDTRFPQMSTQVGVGSRSSIREARIDGVRSQVCQRGFYLAALTTPSLSK
jgi:hypothetical protein